ncbi:MAG: hypothetical protein AAFY85_04150 [Pseudomonadota bacterium]
MPTCGCVFASGGRRDFIPACEAEDPADLGLVGEDAEGLGVPRRGSDRFAHGGAVEAVFPGVGVAGPPDMGDMGPAIPSEPDLPAAGAKLSQQAHLFAKRH